MPQLVKQLQILNTNDNSVRVSQSVASDGSLNFRKQENTLSVQSANYNLRLSSVTCENDFRI